MIGYALRDCGGCGLVTVPVTLDDLYEPVACPECGGTLAAPDPVDEDDS